MIMQQISDMHISNFRGIRDLTLEKIGNINLLVGGNNSGKTSVLEAIGTFCRPLDPREWLNTARRREIMLPNVSVIDSLKWFFPQINENTDNLYKGETLVNAQGTFPVRSVNARFQEIISDNLPNNIDDGISDNTRRGADFTLTANIDVTAFSLYHTTVFSESFELWEDENLVQKQDITCPTLPVRTIVPHAHRVERLQIQQFSASGLQELNTSVVSLLQKFDPNIEDLALWAPSGNRPALYIKHTKLGLTPLSSFGDGMRRVVLMATTIPLCRGGILLIDELETAVHIKMLIHTLDWLVRACEENNIQLFASTHSLEAVDAILSSRNIKDDLVMYRLQEPKKGINVIRFDKDLLVNLREEMAQEVRW